MSGTAADAMRFALAVPGDVRFGRGRAGELPGVLTGLGVTRALVVTGRTPTRAEAARRALADAGVDAVVFPVVGEPSVGTVREGVAAAGGVAVRRIGSMLVLGALIVLVLLSLEERPEPPAAFLAVAGPVMDAFLRAGDAPMGPRVATGLGIFALALASVLLVGVHPRRDPRRPEAQPDTGLTA